jgi:hypothetical protein
MARREEKEWGRIILFYAVIRLKFNLTVVLVLFC